MSSNKTIAKNTVMLYIRMLISMLVGLYTSRVVLQTLGVEDYGIYGVVGGVVSMFSFLKGAMSGATSRFLSFEMGKGVSGKLKETFSSALIVHVGIAVIIFVLSETVGLWFLCNKLVIPEGRMLAAHVVYQFSILSMIITVTQVPYNSVIIAREKMNVYAYVELLNVFLKLGIVYLLYLVEYDKLVLYSSLVLAVSFIVAMTNRLYCIKKFEESRFRWVWNPDILRPMLSFSGWDLFGNLSVTTRQQGVNFLINNYFGVVFNAASGVASMLQGVLSGLSYNIITAFRPAIIKNYSAGNKIASIDLLYQGAKFSSLLMMFMSMILIMEMEYVVSLWLVNPPPMALTFCKIMLIDACLYVISDSVAIGIHASGKVKMMSFLSGLCSLSVVPVLWLLYHVGWSVEYAYIVVAISNVFRLIVRSVVLQKYIIEFSLIGLIQKVLFPLVLESVILLLFLFPIVRLMQDGIARLVVICVCGCFIACLSTYYVILSRSQRNNVIAFINKKLKHV